MLKFKSPTLERIMTRLSQSVVGGILFSIALLILIFMTDRGDSELPLTERHPFAWIMFWPELAWEHILRGDHVDAATLITNVVIYSGVTYRFLRWHEDRGRLT
jgi:hypothetical protein